MFISNDCSFIHSISRLISFMLLVLVWPYHTNHHRRHTIHKAINEDGRAHTISWQHRFSSPAFAPPSRSWTQTNNKTIKIIQFFHFLLPFCTSDVSRARLQFERIYKSRYCGFFSFFTAAALPRCFFLAHFQLDSSYARSLVLLSGISVQMKNWWKVIWNQSWALLWFREGGEKST